MGFCSDLVPEVAKFFANFKLDEAVEWMVVGLWFEIQGIPYPLNASSLDMNPDEERRDLFNYLNENDWANIVEEIVTQLMNSTYRFSDSMPSVACTPSRIVASYILLPSGSHGQKVFNGPGVYTYERVWAQELARLDDQAYRTISVEYSRGGLLRWDEYYNDWYDRQYYDDLYDWWHDDLYDCGYEWYDDRDEYDDRYDDESDWDKYDDWDEDDWDDYDDRYDDDDDWDGIIINDPYLKYAEYEDRYAL